jgi:RimJ/RimL family protein N-acetyltransferase
VPAQIVFGAARILEFINRHRPLEFIQGMRGIGLERDGKLVCGIIYEGWNYQSIWAHIAAEPGSNWLNKEYLRFCCDYAFVTCKVNMILGYMEASNTQALRFAKHLGFKEEAPIREAATDGGDILILKMRRQDCRYTKAGD